MIDPMAAFYDRASTDAQLQTLVGTDADGDTRLYPEFPDEELGQADYPRITYHQVTGSRPGKTLGEVLVQTDTWVWPEGANGGPDRLHAIDERMLALFHGEGTDGAVGIRWTFVGAHVISREAGSRDFPTAAGTPLRRRRNYRLTVSSL